MVSVFPFVTAAVQTSAPVTSLPIFREYAYDYVNNCLLLQAGRPYLLEKDEALKIWIYHALKVARYRYVAHSREYGNELDRVVGRADNFQIVESEIQRYITEALMVNPYIQEIKDFTFNREKRMQVVFEVTTIYGRFTYESEVYNE